MTDQNTDTNPDNNFDHVSVTQPENHLEKEHIKNKKFSIGILALPLILALIGVTIYLSTQRVKESTETRSKADVEALRFTLSATEGVTNGIVVTNEYFRVSVWAQNEGAFQTAATQINGSFSRDKFTLVGYEANDANGFFRSAVPQSINEDNIDSLIWSNTIAEANNTGILTHALGAFCTKTEPWQCFPQTESSVILTFYFRAKTTTGTGTITLTSVEAASIENCDPQTLNGCSTNIGELGTPAEITLQVATSAFPTNSPSPETSNTPIITNSPTITEMPTATLTQSPGSANAQIKIKLQGITAANKQADGKLILKQDENVMVQKDFTAVSDASGTFTANVVNIDPGTYDVYVKPFGHLARKLQNPVEFTADPTVVLDFGSLEFYGGDTAGNPPGNDGMPVPNGTIDIIDSSPFTTLFSDLPGFFNTTSIPLTLAPEWKNVDLNIDGTIDIIDLMYVVNNYRDGHVNEDN